MAGGEGCEPDICVLVGIWWLWQLAVRRQGGQGGFDFIKTPLCEANGRPRPGCRLPRRGTKTHTHTRIHEHTHMLWCTCCPLVFIVVCIMCIPISVPFFLKKKLNLLHAVVSSLANEEVFFSSLWAKKCKMF